jgi:hypothetical protein
VNISGLVVSVMVVAVTLVVDGTLGLALDFVLAGFFAVNHVLTHGVVLSIVAAVVVAVAVVILFPVVDIIIFLPFSFSL